VHVLSDPTDGFSVKKIRLSDFFYLVLEKLYFKFDQLVKPNN